MSDDEKRERSWIRSDEVPSWTQDLIGVQSVVNALEDEDKEDTLMAQLTSHEVVMITFGLNVLGRLFPELNPVCAVLSVKFRQLARAQEFIPEDPSEGGVDT